MYKNKKRSKSHGTQNEIPNVNCLNGTCIVTGYQYYTITKNNLVVNQGYKAKFYYIKNFLLQHTENCSSVLDIGASNGLVSFVAAQAGYPIVHALDHDLDCIQVITKIKRHLQIQTVFPQVYSFGDDHSPADIVIVGALIHWIYSCTALYGNFDEITRYLRGLTKKYLLIEWVNPNDPAIRSFHHTSFNRDVIKEPYTRANFLASMKKYFSSQKVHSVNNTRELFLCVV